MTSRTLRILFSAFVVLTAFAASILLAGTPQASVRNFEFTYITKVPALPPSAQSSRVWIPLPQSDAYQAISDLHVTSPFAYSRQRESEYGNEYLFIEIPAAKAAQPVEIQLTFRATRREHKVPLNSQAKPASFHPDSPAAPELQRFLQPDRRVPLQGVIAQLSADQTKGLQDPIAKARAVYDYVLATMRYDKSGAGWGQGDAIWACTAKRGNCTDFHSLFIGMMRVAGIPARFEIGFSLPDDRHEGAISGYHCWAEFYVAPYGWIPVDASEAWKHPEKRDYFFGAHDADRIQFTLGRDIRLMPQQQADPLNYFIYPYAELDSKPLTLESKFSFRDLSPASSRSSD